jgi:hypothetical protein
MIDSKITKLSESYGAENRTEIKDLPFIKLNEDQTVFRSVKPSGDYDKDCQIGREYGALALEHMRKADFAPLLTWCIMDMPRKKDCSGIEAGFLEFFAEIAVSNFTSNSNQLRKLSN